MRKVGLSSVLFSVFLCVVWVLQAAGSGTPEEAPFKAFDGADFQINTVTTGGQGVPAVEWIDGQFVVVWQGPDADGEGIKGQFVGADGTLSGAELLINDTESKRQATPDVAALASSGFVVVWEGPDDYGSGIKGRLFQSDGTAVGVDFTVNTYTSYAQSSPAVSADAAGDFVVVWYSRGSLGNDQYGAISAQRFASDGSLVGGEAQINTYTSGLQDRPDVARTAVGDYFVVWQTPSSPEDPDAGIRGRLIAADGTPQNVEFQVNTWTTGAQLSPKVGATSDGRFVVAWSSQGADGDGYGVAAQWVAADGSPEGDEFVVSTGTAGDQFLDSVSVGMDGVAMIAWTHALGDGIDDANRAKRFSPEGDPLGGDLIVNAWTTGHQGDVVVSAGEDGEFLATFTSATSPGDDGDGTSILGSFFRLPVADVSVDKTVDLAEATPGDRVEFQIQVDQAGPADLEGLIVVDAVPMDLEDIQWDCVPSDGASCRSGEPAMTVDGGVDDVVILADVPKDERLDISVRGTVKVGTPVGTIDNVASVDLNYRAVDEMPVDNADNAAFEVVETDFGDAPEPFPTLAADDGARHIVTPNTGFGDAPDPDEDGQPDPQSPGDPPATGDDNDSGGDDEAGIVFVTNPVVCTDSEVLIAPKSEGVVNAWLDFDQSGSWTPDEQIFIERTISGFGSYVFTVPCTAMAGEVVGRFRISTAGGDGITGRADDGEVEDHLVQLVKEADFGINVSASTDIVAGAAVVLEVTVSNAGPSPTNAEVTIVLPTALSLASWQCNPAGSLGADCSPADAMSRSATGTEVPTAYEVEIPGGESLAFTLTGDLDGFAEGNLEVSASVAILEGTDGNSSNDTFTFNQPILHRMNLGISLSDDTEVAVLNDSLEYRLVVRNTGPTHAVGAKVLDGFPQLTGISWTCSTDSAACAGSEDLASCQTGQALGTPANAGGVPIDESVDILAGGCLEFVASGTVVDPSNTQMVVNEASVLPPGQMTCAMPLDTDCSDNSATDTNTLVFTDFGDAPSASCDAEYNYPTLLADGGAHHAIRDGISLGAAPDAEQDGQIAGCNAGDDDTRVQGNSQIRDDEDGFRPVFNGGEVSRFIACEPVTFELVTLIDSQVGDAGNLSLWIDLDQDGDWQEDEQLIPHPDFDGALSSGVHEITVEIPCEAVSGTTYARFRFSTDADLGPGGFASDGEVEDYPIQILGLDFGDSANHPTTLAQDGARHVVGDQVTGNDIYLGGPPDEEAMPSPTVAADGDDNTGVNDEDGVNLLDTEVAPFVTTSWIPDHPAQVEVSAPALCDSAFCLLQVWVDANGNGSFGDSGERLKSNFDLKSGVQKVTLDVPATNRTGVDAVVRYRLSSEVVADPTGLALDGEVEDHLVPIIPVANVSISRLEANPPADGPGSVDPFTYTIEISNPGPNPVIGAEVEDIFNSVLVSPSWQCVAVDGTCTAGPVVGDIIDTVNIEVGGKLTYSVSAQLAADAAEVLGGGDLVNTVSVSLPDGIVNLNADDLRTIETPIRTVIVAQADLGIAVTDGIPPAPAAVPGELHTFLMTVSNAGPAEDPEALVSAIFDDYLVDKTLSWACEVPLGSQAVCTDESGSGLPDAARLRIPSGSTATYTVTGMLSPSVTGFASISGSVVASVLDDEQGNNSASDTDTAYLPEAELTLRKADAVDPVAHGNSVTYTVEVCNDDGPSDATGVQIADPLREDLAVSVSNPSTRDVDGGCTEGTAGVPTCTVGGIAVGACVSFEVTGTVDAATTGLFDNMISVSSTNMTVSTSPESDFDETTCFYPVSSGLPGGQAGSLVGEFPLSVQPGALQAPRVALAGSTLVAVWESAGGTGPDIQGSSIRGRLFQLSATGLDPMGPAFQVNQDDLGDQFSPDVVMAEDGRFVVVWTEDSRIEMRWFQPDGSPAGDESTVSTLEGVVDLGYPSVALAPGAPGEETLTASERVFVVWQSFGSAGDDDASWSIQRRVFDSNGVEIAAQEQLNTEIDGFQQYPRALWIPTERGEFAVVWQSEDSSGAGASALDTDRSIQMMRTDRDGNPFGVEQQVNQAATAGAQGRPHLAANQAGAHAVVWQSESSPDGKDDSGTGIVAQRFRVTGERSGSEFQVNEVFEGDQTHPTVGLGEDENLVISWQSAPLLGPDADGDGFGIYRRSFAPDANNTAFDGDTLVNKIGTAGNQELPAMVMTSDGDYLIAWQGESSPCRLESSVSAALRIVGKSDLSVVFTEVPANPAIPGQGSVDLKLQILNSGPDAVEGAFFSLDRPQEVENLLWTCDGNASCDSGLLSKDVELEIGELSPGAPIEIQLFIEVAASANCSELPKNDLGECILPILGEVIVGTGVSDPNIGNNSNTLELVLEPTSDLAINKEVNPTEITPGDGTSLLYEIGVNNPGPSAAYGITVSDVLPAELICTDLETNEIITELNAVIDLQFGESEIFNISCEVPAGVLGDSSGMLKNIATAIAPPETTDPNSRNEAKAETILTGAADLKVVICGPDEPVLTAEEFDFDVGVFNCGPSVSRSVNVDVVLPENVAFIGSSETCNEIVEFNGTTRLACNLGDIASTPASERCGQDEAVALACGLDDLADTVTFTANPGFSPVEVGDATPKTFTVSAETASGSTDDPDRGNNGPLDLEVTLRSDFRLSVGELPAVAEDPSDGDFVIVWTDDDEIRGRRVAVNGSLVGSEMQINTYATGRQTDPAVAVAADGSFLVVWSSDPDVTGQDTVADIQGRLFNSSGEPQGEDFEIAQGTSLNFDQLSPEVVAVSQLGNGAPGFVVVWEGNADDGDLLSGGIRGRQIGMDGMLVGNEAQINSVFTGAQFHAAIDALDNGDFTVAWSSQTASNPQDAPLDGGLSIQAQRFGPGFARIGDEFQVNSTVENDQDFPALSSIPSGEVFFSWEDGAGTEGTDIQGRLFCADGLPGEPDSRLNLLTDGDQRKPVVGGFGDSSFLLVWRSSRFVDSLVQDFDPTKAQLINRVNKTIRLDPDPEEAVVQGTNIEIVDPVVAIYEAPPSEERLGRGGEPVSLIVWEADGSIFGRLESLAGAEIPLDDSDSDSVFDLCDRCPGRDDLVDLDSDGIPDCLQGTLSVTKVDDQEGAVAPGSAIEYTIMVTNGGPGDAYGLGICDLVPSDIQDATWQCATAIGSDASCVALPPGDTNPQDTASGGPNIGTWENGECVSPYRVDLPSGEVLTFTVSGTVDPQAENTLVNTVTLIPDELFIPDEESVLEATETTGVQVAADLGVLIIDPAINVTAGTSSTYDVELTNAGPAKAENAQVTLDFGEGFAPGDWTCEPQANSTESSCSQNTGSGEISNLRFTLAPSEKIFISVPGALDPDTRVTLTTTATVEVDPAGSTVDPNSVNDAATSSRPVQVVSDLEIQKEALCDPCDLFAGGTVDYRLTVKNHGPSSTMGALVEDTFVSDLDADWCRTDTAGGCVPNIGGNISEAVDLQPGAEVYFEISAEISESAGSPLVNRADVSLAEAGASQGDDTFPNFGQVSANVGLSADLELVEKTTLTSPVVAGSDLRYRIVARNNGPSTVSAVLRDNVPTISGVDVFNNPTWSCSCGSSGVSCPDGNSGAGDLVLNMTLANGASVSCEFGGTLRADARGQVFNRAFVRITGSGSDPNFDNDEKDVTDEITLDADLRLEKRVSATTPGPFTYGDLVQYEIVASHASGASDILAARISDNFPTGLGNITWSCRPEDDCVPSSGNGSNFTNVVVGLPVDEEVVFTVDAVIAPDAGAELVNRVVGTADEDPDGADASVSIDVLPDLSITKTNGTGSVIAGGSTTWILRVPNPSPQNVRVNIVDEMPAAVESCVWTCDNGGDACSIPPTTDLDIELDLAADSEISLTAECALSSSATGALSNTATVSWLRDGVPTDDADSSNNSSTDLDDILRSIDLTVFKTNETDTVVTGREVIYSIEVTNAGTSDAIGATLSDPFPAELNVTSVTCEEVGGASCRGFTGSTIDGALIDLPASPTAKMTFTVTGTVAEDASGNLVNEACVTLPAGDDVNNEEDGDDCSEDSDPISQAIDLSIVKSVESGLPIPGTELTYLIVAKVETAPAGTVKISDISITDTLPEASLFEVQEWSCTALGNTDCPDPSSGSSLAGPILTNIGTSATDSIEIRIRGLIPLDTTGMLTNRANIVAPEGFFDVDEANNFSQDQRELTPVVLEVTKTTLTDPVVAGSPVSFQMTLTNTGTGDAVDVQVLDEIPSELATNVVWSCSVQGSADCGSLTAGGNGNISGTVSLPAGAGNTVTLDLSGTVSPDATGMLQNTITASLGLNESSADVQDQITQVVSLAVSKTNNADGVTPDDDADEVKSGDPVTYVMEISNGGLSNGMVLVQDTIPTELVGDINWTCAAEGSADCGDLTAGGSSDISGNVSLPADATRTSKVILTLTGTAGTAGETLANTVSATFGDDAVSATDSDPITSRDTDLAVTLASSNPCPGFDRDLFVKAVVFNNGPGVVTDGVITLPFPTEGFADWNWSCVLPDSSSCGTGAQGTGDIQITGLQLAEGEKVTLNVNVKTAMAAENQDQAVAQLTFSADSPTLGDTDPSNDSADLTVPVGGGIFCDGFETGDVGRWTDASLLFDPDGTDEMKEVGR